MRKRGTTGWWLAGLAVASLAVGGCDEDNTSVSTPPGVDAADDTTMADTHTGDAHAGDTAMGDTHTGDTHTGDTAMGDTAMGDTHAGDTHLGDTHAGDTHAGDAHAGDTHAGDSHAGDTHDGPPHWTYSGEEGPDHWGDLDPAYAACKDGKEQSPIDIPAAAPSNHPEMTFDYKPSALHILNNGHTVQANYDAGSSLEVGGETWDLVQFHYHAHSEHTVEGTSFPAELHFVHKNTAGELAVVGVLLEDGAETAALNAFTDNLPTTEQAETTVDDVNIDAAGLLPAGHASWRYEGSLTTPPCTEGVSWFVMSEPLTASAGQIAKLTEVFDHNFRPTQPLEGREVEGPHWSYEGEAGPDHWADLSPDWETCGTGVEQSPIDIPAGIPADVPATFTTTWGTTPLTIVNNGHTVQVNYTPGSSLTLADGTYELLQFHFHAHSEHLTDTSSHPLEIHFVHKSAAGKLAVVGVFVDSGAESEALKALEPYLPATKGDPATIPGVDFDASTLLPSSLESWRYSGSLTTPPCSEGVSWNVLAQPIEASPAQIGAFAAVLHDNARPEQPLNGRPINGM